MRGIELFFSIFGDEGARASCFLVKPICYICSCCLNDGFDFWQVSMFLDQGGEVVDIVEEAHPDIVGTVMSL